MDFVSHLTELCRAAGLEAAHPLSDTMIGVPFTGEAGEVVVFVRARGELRGSPIVELGTAGIALPAEPAERAIIAEAALVRNAGLVHGRWSIVEADGVPRRLAVLANLYGESLVPEQLRAAAETIALEHLSLAGALEQARRA